jgi:inhibitor of KinA
MSAREPEPSGNGESWRIAPLGDRALVIELGRRVDPQTHARVREVAALLSAAALPGATDVVPAFTTVALHYRPEAWHGDAPYDALRIRVEGLVQGGSGAEPSAARVVEIPVCYGGEFGPDLEEVALACGLTPAEVIERHAASPHVVYMLGFSPGMPYLGGLDPRLFVPRRATPRTAVAAGSVAIARDQSIVYPNQTPGGWNVLGRTPMRLFDPTARDPCALQPGDAVRFVAISVEQLRAADCGP